MESSFFNRRIPCKVARFMVSYLKITGGWPEKRIYEVVINVENEIKKCAGCQCDLPDGWEQDCCETCRAKKKSLGQTLLDLMMAPGIIAMSIATRGNRRYKKEK